MATVTSSSSSSKTSPPAVNDNDSDLFDFYKRRYDETLRKEDEYKEKIDRHLRNLAKDRKELEEENLKRGAKIADLQKALVELQLSLFEERERFLQVSIENTELKKKVEELHASIRQLLSLTKQQDLRDKIIYILEDPKVDIAFRTNASAKSRPAHEVAANRKLQEEINNVKHQLDEVLKVSKTKSDVVLEDCKQALEKARTKIVEDERLIKELRKQLQEVKYSEKNKSSVASSSSLERQRAAKPTKSVSWENPVFVTATKRTGENQPSIQNIPLGNQQYATADRTLLGGSRRYATAARSVAEESQQYITSTRSASGESQQYSRATRSAAAESQQYSRTTRSASEESVLTAQSLSDSEMLSKLISDIKAIHFSLILLKNVIDKIKKMLNSIKATKLYYRLAKIPTIPTDLQYFADEDVIHQLESSFRQCTMVSFDINNMYAALWEFVIENRYKIQNFSDLKFQLKHLEELVKEISRLTADNDLHNVSLQRLRFFEAVRNTSVVLPEQNRTYCLEEYEKITSNCETLTKTISDVVGFVESILGKIGIKKDMHDIAQSMRGFSYLSSDAHSSTSRVRPVLKSTSDESLKQSKSKSLQDLESLVDIYKRAAQDSESIGLSAESLTARIAELKDAQRVLQEIDLEKCDDNYNEEIMGESDDPPSPSSSNEDVMRHIDKTLSKVEMLKQGRYFKDEDMCRKLVANINALTQQFKEFTEEVNMNSVQDSYSEYYKVTLSRLEELAKKCKTTVHAAEAQLAAHRSNTKDLHEKLKQTEDLLRTSINECLSLKRKIKQNEEKHVMERHMLLSNLKQKLRDPFSSQDVNEIVDELVSDLPVYELPAKSRSFVCMYCRNGPGHAACEEKISDLQAECRKFKTELKHLKQETDQEKSTLQHHHAVAEYSLTNLTNNNKALQGKVQALEKENSSLKEQLKVLKNRLKNLERFRRLEIEGFHSEMKLIKEKLKESEKQMLKALCIVENNNRDIELLKTVHETAQRSMQTTREIRRLKAALYTLENDMKSL